MSRFKGVWENVWGQVAKKGLNKRLKNAVKVVIEYDSKGEYVYGVIKQWINHSQQQRPSVGKEGVKTAVKKAPKRR